MKITDINSIDTLKVFIKEGGNINENISLYNNDKHNILFYLLRKNGKKLSLPLFEEVIKSGANINFLNDQNESLLFYAHSKELAEMLIKYNIDTTIKNKDGLNPLLINLLPIEVEEVYFKHDMNISELTQQGNINYFKSLLMPTVSKDTVDRMLLGLKYLKSPLPEDIVAIYLTVCKNERKWYSEDSLKKCLNELIKKGLDITLYTEEFKYVFENSQRYYEQYVSPYMNLPNNDKPKFCPFIERMNDILLQEYFNIIKRKDKMSLYFKENIIIKYSNPETIAIVEKTILSNLYSTEKKYKNIRI